MREAADTRTYAAALSVLVVAKWLYFDWASRAPQPLPNNFVHAEWITLHDNPNFRGFVDWPAISTAGDLADHFAIGPMFPPEPTMPRDHPE
jgi:thiaminase